MTIAYIGDQVMMVRKLYDDGSSIMMVCRRWLEGIFMIVVGKQQSINWWHMSANLVIAINNSASIISILKQQNNYD